MVIAMAIVISGGNSNSDSNSISDSNSTRSQFKRSRFVSMNPYEGIFPPPRRFSLYHVPAEPEVGKGLVGQGGSPGTREQRGRAWEEGQKKK